ncbi:uncharacterized protein LOC127872198 [Dreissena polymorpha]|uniref:uncharacterized protein LOC127872198 n=1 Tax=Dreissena polymorpha TaxID=45954 RepID=UPI0022643AB5|nr:uncharacterized protein LOC127872198 [Dreissena polymorpha]
MWMYSFILFLGYLNQIWSQDSTDCSPNDQVPCKKHGYRGTNCSEGILSYVLRDMPYITGSLDYPGSPSNLRASAQYKWHHKSEKHLVEVNLTITPPANGGLKFLKGFEVVRIMPDYVNSCYILNLSDVTWTTHHLQTTFELSLFPLKPSVQFIVYSLPKYKPGMFDAYRNLIVKMPVYTNDSEAWNWAAEIFLDLLEEDGVINVTINSPPEEFKFTSFEYRLISNNTTVKHDIVNKLNYRFYNVTSGEYNITVKPYDPGYMTMDTSKCLCPKKGMVATCDQCVTTHTPKFNFTLTSSPCLNEPKPSYCYPTAVWTNRPVTTQGIRSLAESSHQLETTAIVLQQDSSDQLIVDLSVGGVVLCLVTAGVVSFVLLRKCKKKEAENADKEKTELRGADDLPTAMANDGFVDVLEDDGMSVLTYPNNLNKGGLLQFEKKPKLFLLYEDENEHHRRVVTTFGTYLQTYCQCDVMMAEFTLDAPWVHQDLERADYTVVINSEGAFRANMSPSSKPMSSINSLRNKFKHEEKYDKIVMVYFEYTDEQFIIPDICPGFKYKLMKHFSDFLLHVHKIYRADKDLVQYDLPLDGNLQHRPIGHQLAEAIAQVIQYEQNKPKRAMLTGSNLLSWNRQNSDDSRYDSGLQSDIGSPGVFSINENELWPLRPNLLAMMQGESDTITITPSDVGILYDINCSQDAFNNEPSDVNNDCGNFSVSKKRPHFYMAMDPGKYPSKFVNQDSVDSGKGDFEFIAPEDFDESDVLSKTLSNQMLHFVDCYEQTSMHGSVPSGSKVYSSGQQNDLSKSTHPGYDRSADLQILQTQFENDDVISLGGVSI